MSSVVVRVWAAINKDLRSEIDRRKFREYLFHRLQVININVPSLNDRREDIPELVSHFTEKICTSNGYPKKRFTKEAIQLLQEHNWTGNIREQIGRASCRERGKTAEGEGGMDQTQY